MNYTMNDLLNGAGVMARSVFGRRNEYHLQFNHEEDGCWYIDFPGWPFDHHNLMMVAGADKLCDFLSSDDKYAHVDVIPASSEEDHPGSTYQVTGLEGFERDIWLCPVTLFVLGRYPKYLYIRKSPTT